MKRKLRFALVCLSLVTVVTACSSPSGGPPNGPTGPKTYNIGDTGPADGLIFYDQGSVINGWRYLEAGLSDLGAGFGWGATTASGVTATAIGTGKTNTDAIYALYGSGPVYAARTCKLYSSGGYSDWFLASKDECTQMLSALALHGIGSFSTTYSYWSSSEESAGYAYLASCNGSTVSSGRYDKSDRSQLIRPIRQF